MAYSKNNDLVKSDEHYTPAWIFEGLGVSFDLDVCAPKGGVPHIPAAKSFSIEDDGLTQQWYGNVWMNPPFTKPSPWVEKFITNGQGIALMVVSRSKWFQDIWKAADAVMPTVRDLRFDRPNDKAKQISFQTFLFAMGEQNVKALHNLGNARVR
jgi:hypothetical protein